MITPALDYNLIPKLPILRQYPARVIYTYGGMSCDRFYASLAFSLNVTVLKYKRPKLIAALLLRQRSQF